MNLVRRIVGSLLFAAIAASPAKANPDIYRDLVASTVWIIWADGDRIHMGSGVLVDVANRLVVTNEHVVGDASEVVVYFAACDENDRMLTDRRVYIANLESFQNSGIASIGHVVERLKHKDLALVQLEQLPAEAQAVRLAEAGSRPGDRVHSIGNSSDEALWRYTPGEVRNIYRRKDGSLDAYVVETTSPVNPGDSGGPMVNDNGELIGVVESRYPSGRVTTNSRGEVQYAEGQRLVSFAIDVLEIHWLLQMHAGLDYAPVHVDSADEHQPASTDG
jgi:S1-C subfamily serine protease